jgi:branched-chain amino acid transport system permease protein
MNFFLQVMISGLLLGTTYALLGVGFSLIWGVARVLNITHAIFAVLAAYAAYWPMKLYNLDPFLTLLGIIPLFFLLGVLLYEGPIRLLERRTPNLELSSLVLTFGLAYALENMMAYLWSPGPRLLNTPYTGHSLSLLGIYFPLTQVYSFLLSVVTIVALYLFLYHTHLGKAVRAVWQDRDGAVLSGVNLHSVTAITYGVAIASAGVAGVAMALIYAFNPAIHLGWLIYIFLVVIMGGVGSMLGAGVAGLFTGLVINLSVLFIPFAWSNLLLFIGLLLLLFIRPRGLLQR